MGKLKQAAAKVRAAVKSTREFIDGTAAQKQLESIENSKREYLSAENEKEMKDQLALERNLQATRCSVFRSYLPHVKDCYEPPKEDSGDKESLDEEALSTEANNRVMCFDVTKWVEDPRENSIEKLSSVYQSLCGEQCAVALIYRRTADVCRVTLAVANHAQEGAPTIVQGLSDRLRSALRGNFPGSECTKAEQGILQGFEVDPQENTETPEPGVEPQDNMKAPEQGSEKNAPAKTDPKYVSVVTNTATEKSEKFISQGIEKLLDGFVPVPTKPEEEYTLVLLGAPLTDCTAELQALYDRYTVISPFASVQCQQSISDSSTAMQGVNGSAGVSQSHSKTMSGSAGVNVFGAQVGASESRSTSFGMNAMLGRHMGTSKTVGLSDGKTMTYTNSEVRHMLSMLETQIKRLEQCRALGAWRFAAYVFSANEVMAENVAHMYASLTQGEASYLEPVSINSWGNNEAETSRYIRRCLSGLQHPVFCLKENVAEEKLIYPVLTDLTTVVSGKELARAMNFPQKSVAGFPVTESAAFGRSVSLLDHRDGKRVKVGQIWHMRRADGGTVELDEGLLTSHVFITGSTGSGKSNTVYQLLNKLCGRSSERHFLVVEPTKGEYKGVFGGRSDVSVYGTNYKKTDLLRLNPFSFPEGVQLLAHLDHLAEVFNACWPMYAAMPAVLKDAMERAYVEAGWDVRTSENQKYGRLFPTFTDVLRQIDLVMDESDYSGDSKGDYKGALKTRLKSLTNGIYSDVFGCDELSEAELFDQNVIIDLSEVGSETTSLIMGMLVLKLQEYRMASNAVNEELRHITVLEEAHNLLKRTSTEQTSENANPVGKSVEMLTNAIAEMRTYGECFMIVDQAPGALDPAAIRNTNTKIVLRLPDYSDRELVGRSIGLNDDQITELGKLEQGVAAVYQSGWIESVLCKFDLFDAPQQTPAAPEEYQPYHFAGILLNAVLYGTQVTEFADVIRSLKDTLIYRSALPLPLKRQIWDACASDGPIGKEHLAAIAYELLNADVLYAKTDEPARSEVARQFRLTSQRYQIADAALDQDNLNILMELLAQEHRRRETNCIYGAFMGGVR